MIRLSGVPSKSSPAEHFEARPGGDYIGPVLASSCRPNTVAGTPRKQAVPAESATSRSQHSRGLNNQVTKMNSILRLNNCSISVNCNTAISSIWLCTLNLTEECTHLEISIFCRMFNM